MLSPGDLVLIMGIEVECSTDKDPGVGGYHDGRALRGSNGWVVDSDSSLEPSGDSENMNGFYWTAEYVSPPFQDSLLKNTVNDLKKALTKERKDLCFPFHFNHSAGAHVHVTAYRKADFICSDHHTSFDQNCIEGRERELYITGKPLMLSAILTKPLRKWLYQELKRRINDDAFAKHYYRPQYAAEVCDGYECWARSDRYVEVAFCDSSHVEVRSFNLMGVSSWETLLKRYQIFIDVFKDTIIRGLNQKKKSTRTEAVPPPKTKSKKRRVVTARQED